MKAFWTRPCAYCSKPIQKGSEMHYVSYNQTAFHPSCANTGPEGPEPEEPQIALAERLGYVKESA